MVGLRLDTEARLQGVLRLRGVVHAVGGPDVLRGCVFNVIVEAGRACSPAPSPCRGRDRRLRRLQAPRPARPLPLRRLLPRQPTFQQPRPRLQPPRPGPPDPTACAAPRSPSCARCPTSSRRRSINVVGQPMICGGGCGWPARGRAFRRTYSAASCRSCERGCERRRPPWPLLASAPASGSTKRFRRSLGAGQPHVLVRGLGGSLQRLRVRVLAGLHEVEGRLVFSGSEAPAERTLLVFFFPNRRARSHSRKLGSLHLGVPCGHSAHAELALLGWGVPAGTVPSGHGAERARRDSTGLPRPLVRVRNT